MKFIFFVAKRYFLSKHNTNAINIISFVSMLAVMVVTIAMLIIFSSLNGFEGLVKSLYRSFYPDIMITAKEGKSFVINKARFTKLKEIRGIEGISEVLEEKALVTSQDKQVIAVIKGVDEEFAKVNGVNNKIIRGVYKLYDEIGNPRMIVGAGIEARLNLNVTDPLITAKIHMPKRSKRKALMIKDAFKIGRVYPSGTFSIQQEFDAKYILVPIKLTRRLLHYSDEQVTGLELKLDKTENVNRLKTKIETLYGDAFNVRTRYEQNQSLYQVMNMESWVVYCLLTLILFIAGFNILGSLIMLVLDKTKDIFILRSMGASAKMIRAIFLAEGMLFSGLGALLGVIFSVIMILCQQSFGIVEIPGGTFVISAYPMDMEIEDFLLVFFTVMIISLLSSWYPAKAATRKSLALKGQY